MTSRTCESAASCFAQPPLASPRRIFSTPVSFPCAWSRRHLSLRAARALRHRESQRVERAGFGLRHGRLRAHHSAYTPLPKRGIALSFSIVKSFKQFRALPNWFVLNRLCGCSASRARLGTKAHFGDVLRFVYSSLYRSVYGSDHKLIEGPAKNRSFGSKLITRAH